MTEDFTGQFCTTVWAFLPHFGLQLWVRVIITFNNISVISWCSVGGGNQNTWRKPL